MTNMLAETGAMLTETQTKIVRALDEALEAFFAVDVLPTSGDLAAKHNEVVLRSLELQREFPKLAEQAVDYHDDEFPEEPEFTSGGPAAALFELMLSLRSFMVAQKFSEFIRLRLNLRDEMADVKSYSENWDWERGDWK